MIQTFEVHLKDGRTVIVGAESYVLDNGKYTFNAVGSSEFQWFLEEDVSGISIRRGGIEVVRRGSRRNDGL